MTIPPNSENLFYDFKKVNGEEDAIYREYYLK